METNKETLSSEEEYNNSIEQICDSIMSNIITYLSDDVYVEKNDNFFTIKSFHNTKDKKEFSIKINRSEFHFNLYSKNSGIGHPGIAYISTPSYNNPKEKNYENGNFTVKINSTLFNRYEKWLIIKCNDYLLQKINSLKTNLYKDFNLDKVIKRKHVTNAIINEKEDL